MPKNAKVLKKYADKTHTRKHMNIEGKIISIKNEIKDTLLDSMELLLELDKIESLKMDYPESELHKFIKDSIVMVVGLRPQDDLGKKVLHIASL